MPVLHLEEQMKMRLDLYHIIYSMRLVLKIESLYDWDFVLLTPEVFVTVLTI